MRVRALETVSIDDAKTRLSQLVDKAAAGEDVVVSRNGKPLVRITKLETPKRRIRFGWLKGRLTVPEDFDAPLHADQGLPGLLAALVAAFGNHLFDRRGSLAQRR